LQILSWFPAHHNIKYDNVMLGEVIQTITILVWFPTYYPIEYVNVVIGEVIQTFK